MADCFLSSCIIFFGISKTISRLGCVSVKQLQIVMFSFIFEIEISYISLFGYYIRKNWFSPQL